jgi:6-phosphogluconolactonase
MSALPVPRVEVHESPDELATSVAGAFLRLVAVRQASGDIPQVALTGGTIADKIHR